jgi:SAM-dependent methyltransferase
MKATWNERYQNSTYQYGINPNDFLTEQLQGLQPGRILVPAAGEGRDMVYVAKLGWEAYGFDLSEQGEAKAIKLARDQQVNIHFKCTDAFKINYPLESFDVIALSFFHLPPDMRKAFHQRCVTWLKPGGRIILEGFNKSQLGKTSGGPKQVDWLFSSQELAEDFKGLTVQINEEKDRLLDEGLLHQGIASVIQFTAIN